MGVRLEEVMACEMKEPRTAWQRGRAIKLSPKRLWVKGLRVRVKRLFKILTRRWRWWCVKNAHNDGSKKRLVKEYCGRRAAVDRSNSFYADAIAECIDFIKRSSLSAAS